MSAIRDFLKEPLKVQSRVSLLPLRHDFRLQPRSPHKEIEEYYQANRDSKFHKPKAVKARYILVRVPPGADAKQKTTPQTRANRILTEARAGKDFAQLAKQESEDSDCGQRRRRRLGDTRAIAVAAR